MLKSFKLPKASNIFLIFFLFWLLLNTVRWLLKTVNDRRFFFSGIENRFATSTETDIKVSMKCDCRINTHGYRKPSTDWEKKERLKTTNETKWKPPQFFCLHISGTWGIFVCKIVIEKKSKRRKCIWFFLARQWHYFMEFWWRHGDEFLYNQTLSCRWFLFYEVYQI